MTSSRSNDRAMYRRRRLTDRRCLNKAIMKQHQVNHSLVRSGVKLLALASLLLSWSSAAQTWEDISANVPGAITTSNQGVMATDGTRLYALGAAGVFVSEDGGASFTAVNTVQGASYNLGQYGHRFVGVANGLVWVGTDPGSAAFNDGLATLHRLTPGQAIWQKSSTGFPVGTTGNQADDLAYDASTGTYYAVGALGGVFVSTDGVNWEARNNGNGGLGLPATVEAFNGVAFSVRPLGGVNRTTDQGVNWTATGGIPGPASGTLLRLGNRILIATQGYTTLQDGLYYSDDLGVTWTFTQALSTKMDLTTDGTLGFAAAPGGALYYSGTAGTTWDTLSNLGITGSPNRLLKVGANLFVHTAGKLFRAPASSFNFTPSTQIVKQPVSSPTLLEGGGSYTFSVIAGGQNVTYQWKKGADNVPGATGPTLTISPLAAADSGSYTVVVTGDNGTLTSSAVTLTVVTAEQGKVDPTFPQPANRRPGSTLAVLKNYDVIELSGNFIQRFRNTSMAASRNLPTGNFFKLVVDSRGRLVLGNVAFSGNTVFRIDPNTLQDDPTFTPFTLNSSVTDMVELPGRGYLVSFTSNPTLNGTLGPPILLLNYDGNIDWSFNTQGAIYQFSQVDQLIVTPNGEIYARGTFNSWWDGTQNNSQYGGFVRLLANGMPDVAYAPGFKTSLLRAFALRDGRLLIFNGTRPEVYDRDAVRDMSFNSGDLTFSQVSHIPTGITEQFDGKLILSGLFTSYGGVSVDNYVRLNTDGTRDTSFYDAVGLASSATIPSVAYDPQGFVYVTPSTDSTSATWQTSGKRGLSRMFATPASFGIWQQPVGGNIDQGGAVSLSISAFGSGLTYQWFKNGQTIAGATGSVLNLSAFGPSQNGSYTVQVSNGTLTETSQPAALTSVATPEITVQPVSADKAAAASYVLSVSVKGAEPLGYQWRKNGIAINGATSRILSFASLVQANAGRYSVVVTNTFGSVTSAEAVLTVNTNSGTLVSTFTPPAFNVVNVQAVEVLADKTVLVGGAFTTVGGVSHAYFTKLTATGAAVAGGWSENPPGGATGTAVYDFEPLAGGKILMGGDFTAVQGSTYGRLARLNADGTVDTSFVNPAFSGGDVQCVLKLSDGRILVGGNFTSPRTRLAVLNEDGSLDSSFTLSANGSVLHMKLLTNGKVMLSGQFTTLGATSFQQIARLNADLTIDNTFVPTTIPGTIYGFDVDDQGRVVIGGNFTTVGGVSRSRLARLNEDGSHDTTFPDPGTLFLSDVRVVDVQLNGKIVVGGATNPRRLLRFKSDGRQDEFFVITQPNSTVFDLQTTPDGFIYAGGQFNSPRIGMIVYTTDVSDPAVTGSPQSVTVDLGSSTTLSVGSYASSAVTYQWFKNGELLAGQTGAALTLNSIAKSDAGAYHATVTSAQGAATSAAAIVTVRAEPVLTGHPQTQSTAVGGSATFTVSANGKTPLAYQWRKNGVNIPGATSASFTLNNVQNSDAGCYDAVVSNDVGSFTSFPAGLGVYASVGGIDSTFNPGTGPNSTVFAIRKLQDGNIAIGGGFSTVAGQTRGGFAVLDNVGALVSLTSNPPQGGGGARGIAQQTDGKMIVGWSTGGLKRYHTDGTLDGTFPADSNQIESFAVNGTSLYVGGYNGSSVRSLRKFSLVDGSADTAFNANLPTSINGWNLYAICVQSDGKIIVGNSFGIMKRLNPDGTEDGSFTPPTFSYSGGGALKEIYAITQTADGKIWVGGKFDGVIGSVDNQRWLVRLNASGTLDSAVPDLFLNSTVRALVPVGNDVLVGGSFNPTINSKTYEGMLRVSGTTGTIDTSFANAFGDRSIYCMELQAGGTLLVGGDFNTPRSRVARVISQYTGGEAIACPPAPVSVLMGQPFTLAVGWYGGSAATYQWYKNNSPIDGATGQSYVVNVASPADAGSYHVTVTTTGGTMTTNPAVVTVNNAPQSFDQWKESLGFIAGSFGNPGADPDGDSIPNIGEFVLGSHPLQGTSGTKPRGMKVDVAGTDYPAVQFVRNTSASGVSVVVTAAADVGMVNIIPTTVLPPVNLGNGLEQVTIRANTPLNATPTVFFHVTVSQP